MGLHEIIPDDDRVALNLNGGIKWGTQLSLKIAIAFTQSSCNFPMYQLLKPRSWGEAVKSVSKEIMTKFSIFKEVNQAHYATCHKRHKKWTR